MSDAQLDYHVGLLRGFVLAHNAPTQILHALDVLLTDYRSKAGPVIGSQEQAPRRTEIIIPDMMPLKKPEESMLSEDQAEEIIKKQENRKLFWSPADDDQLYDLYCVQDKGPTFISKKIGRTYASITGRIRNKKLVRANQKAE